MVVDIQNISYGCELEWSDIDRRVDIPVELGEWEGPKIAGYYMGSEIDIVNTKGSFRGVATDPLCIKCQVGGEIHVQPSYSIDSQLLRVMRIMDLFPTVGVACPNHGHIHVGLPGIKGDLETLKNLFRYTKENEKTLIKVCCGYDGKEASDIDNSDLEEWVKDYLLVGDGKSINLELYDKVEEAKSVQEVLKYLEEYPAVDYFWSQGKINRTLNSHRTAVNLYNLVKGETVEFRIFRSSVNPVEIYSSLMLCKRYIEEAVRGLSGKPVKDILTEGHFRFAPLNFNEELAKGWQKTRNSKGRCGCFKHYTGASLPSEDLLLSSDEERSEFDKGLALILHLCKMDFDRKEIGE